MITVVKVDRRAKNFTLYIGRAWAGLPASKWANPFRINTCENGTACEACRDVCLARYEMYVRSRPDLMSSLHELDDQVLGCWCHTTPSTGEELYCHGDMLIQLRNEQLADVLRLKQLTDEAIHPTTPSPGHAAGCVCHRCRIARENQ